MAEPDHLFVNPLPNLAQGKNPAAYPFFYIQPTENEKIIRKFYPKGSISNVDPIGSSPVIMAKVQAMDVFRFVLNATKEYFMSRKKTPLPHLK